jgi:fused signal recognition particle receptor
MAFFSKLKERLFKSSSKLDEGLDEIVEAGGTPDPQIPDPDPDPTPDPAPTPEPPGIPPQPDETPPPPPQETPVERPEELPQGPAEGTIPQAPLEIPDTLPDSAPRSGLLGRLLGRDAPRTVTRRALDDDMLERPEDLLITADMGVETAMRVTANMAEGRMGKRLSSDEIKALLAREIARIMDPVARPMPLYAKRPQVVLVVGVNGSGKTTTIGKLASQFKGAGKSVVIAAGDTFRAAAV